MSYEVVKREQYGDGSVLEVVKHHDMYVAILSKSEGVITEYSWKYESESLQSVMVWVNKVKRQPLECRYYESGTYWLPHNDGFGNPDGRRREYRSQSE